MTSDLQRDIEQVEWVMSERTDDEPWAAWQRIRARIAELEADAERRNMLRNADRTRSRCYHFVVSLGELGICGNEQAAAAFMATAKGMRAPHVGRKHIKRIAQEASGGAFGNHDDPYVDAEARDAARGAK